MDDERLAYLALVQVPGMGPTRLHTLLTVCHTPLGAHSASFAFLCTLPGITSACATAIKETPLSAGRHLVEAAKRVGARILVPDDAEFPAALRTIPDPPPVLFALGILPLLDRPAIAIVGSRDVGGLGSAHHGGHRAGPGPRGHGGAGSGDQPGLHRHQSPDP